MAAQPDAGPVADGQPGDRLAGPGRYRTREPVIVEAIQYTGDNDDAVAAFAGWTCVPPGCYVVKGVTGHFFTVDADRFAATYEPADGQRPGDQQLPVPNDGPSMHDLVIADLDSWPDPVWARNAIRDLLAGRKQIGLERYGSTLQSHNGRDAKRDLSEELADGAVYARQVMEERGDGPGSAEAFKAYERILSALFWAMKIPEAGRG